LLAQAGCGNGWQLLMTPIGHRILLCGISDRLYRVAHDG
jgi:hypothetical protein